MNRKITLFKDDIHTGALVLINRDYPIKKNEFYLKQSNLQVLHQCVSVHHLLKESIINILKDINAKHQILPMSGYRTLLEQETLFNESLEVNGREFTEKYVAFPNCSEHQSGLAIDVALNEEDIDWIRPSFPNVGISKLFKDVCSSYGLIERYEKSKESITRISAEEWHFRYIGYPHSKIMKNLDLCLEEYIDYLKQFIRDEKTLIYGGYEISYLKYQETPLEVELDDQEEYSGNNIDGFIFTKRLV